MKSKRKSGGFQKLMFMMTTFYNYLTLNYICGLLPFSTVHFSFLIISGILILSGLKLANADRWFLILNSAELISLIVGTLPNVVLANGIHKTFGFFTLRSSLFT